MKTIFEGKTRLSVAMEDDEYIATIEFNGKGISSSKTNRDYAAIGEVMNEFKKEMINIAKEIK